MRLPLLFVLVCIATVVNAQYDFLMQKSYAERCQSLDTLFNALDFEQEKDTTTLFNNIYKLRELAKQEGDDELVLETIYSERRLRMRKLKRYNHEEQKAILLDLLKKAKKENISHLQILAHYELAYFFNDRKDYGKFFKHLTDCYSLLLKIHDEQFPKKKFFLREVALLYYYYDDFETAEQCLLQALNAPMYYSSQLDEVTILNTLGLIKRNTEQYDSAIYYFERSLMLAKQMIHKHRDFWVDIIGGNIGITYYLKGNYKKALPLMRHDVETSLARNEPRNALNPSIKLGDVYLQQGKIDSARYYAQMVVDMFDHDWHEYKYLMPLYKLLSAYKLLREVELADGNIALAKRYADSALAVNERFIKQKDETMRLRARVKVEQQLYKSELTKLSTEKQLSIQKRNTLIGTLCFLMVVALLLLNRQTIRKRRMKAEKDLADNQLLFAQKRLDDFTDTLHEKNRLLETSSDEITRLKEELDNNGKEQSEEVIDKLQKATILTDDQWREFRLLFEQVHNGFLYKLKQQHPDLTPAEIRYIVLSKLNFSNKEIANTQGISPSACRNYKSRIIKKLSLNDASAFQPWLNSF